MESIEDGGNAGKWADVLQRLPHGKGFRFLDRVTDLDPGTSGRGEWDVREDESFFEGHFPGNPLVPGVIMIEALAQLAGVINQADKGDGGGMLLLTGVRSVKISGTAGPGSTLEIEAKISGKLGEMVMGEGKVLEGGRELMRGEIVLVEGKG